MGILPSEEYTPPEPGYEDLLYCRWADRNEFRKCVMRRSEITRVLAEVETETGKTPTPYTTATMRQRLHDLRLATLRNDMAFTKIEIARSREERRRRIANGSAASMARAVELEGGIDMLRFERRDYGRQIRLLEAAR